MGGLGMDADLDLQVVGGCGILQMFKGWGTC